MKKLTVIVLVLVVVGGIAATYNAYKKQTEADIATRRATLEEREREDRKLTIAKEEAQRLASLQAEQSAAEERNKLEQLRQQEQAAEQQRLAAEAEAMRLQQQLEDLRRQKDAAISFAQNTASQREAELAKIAALQAEALAKLQSVESHKSELVTREAAHAAALERQIELEKQAHERASRLRSTPAR
jgi:dTMP kinase